MKQLILKTNNWYEGLKEPKKTLIYLLITVVPFFITTIIGYGWYGLGWLAFLIVWRLMYYIVK